MTRKYMPLLREATHAALMAENLAVPMRGRNAPFPDEASEICYLALGEPAAKIELHLDNQRNSMPWERHWICDPTHPNSVKVIAFAYRSVAESAISMYAEFGVPAIEVTRGDLPFLVEDFHQILLAEDGDPILLVVGLRLGLVQEWLRRHRHDEIVQCLKDPKSARHACWLLNERNKLFAARSLSTSTNYLGPFAWRSGTSFPARPFTGTAMPSTSRANGSSCRSRCSGAAKISAGR